LNHGIRLPRRSAAKGVLRRVKANETPAWSEFMFYAAFSFYVFVSIRVIRGQKNLASRNDFRL